MKHPEAPATFARRAYGWRRSRVVLVAATAVGALFSLGWKGPLAVLFLRLVFVGFALLTAFAVAERWPRTLPTWAARWALQILAVALTVPIATAAVYFATTVGDPVPWLTNKERSTGFLMISGISLLIAPWVAMVAVYRDISGRARQQSLEFELERARFGQQALQARMNLLQAQVEPHFLFNTLANIRELVQQGSAHAPAMLDNLIAYLRAAVPRLHEASSTIGRELELVRSYLGVMQMRMPDRLQVTVRCDPKANDVKCPPGAILVLVENAVRHGIDPSESGGSIDVDVGIQGEVCIVRVVDTGIGLLGSTPGLGTGLENLRERLVLAYGPAATVETRPNYPAGTCAQLRIPYGGPHDH